jgi:hypothetical protein
MPRHKIEWTDEMLEELVVNFAILSDSVLSQKLRVSISTIRRKAHEMELVKSTVGRNSFQTWVLVEEMFGKHSNREIADAAHVTERTVRRICKRLGLKLPKETRAMYISCSLTKTIKSEKRRILFGLEQRTDRFIGKDKVRNRVFRLLAEHGYIVIKGSMTAYYSPLMKRYEHIEAYAVSAGFSIELWETV